MELRTDRLKLAEVFPDAAKTWAKRLHIKADAIDYVRKGIPIDPADISIEDGERAAIRYVSTPRLDRDGEILLPDGAVLDTFREAPTVLYAHDYSGLPIGRDLWIKPTKRGLLAKTVYANHQLAQDVYDCVKDGFLTSSSVGFIPVESTGMGDKDFGALTKRVSEEYGVPEEEAGRAKRIYTKWVLLEHSDVPVPSNSQSLNVLVGKNVSARLKKDMGVEEAVEVLAVDPPAVLADEPVIEPEPVVAPEPEAVPDDPDDVDAIKSDDSVESDEAAGPYDCECIKCGHRMESDKHCRDLKCPECGGKMRRAERPGPGKAVADEPVPDIMAPVVAELSALRAALALAAMAEPDERVGDVLVAVRELTERVESLTLKVEALGQREKAVEPALVEADPEPVIAPAPDPEPAPAEPPVDIVAAVSEAVRGLDLQAIVQREITLKLSQLRGRVEA